MVLKEVECGWKSEECMFSGGDGARELVKAKKQELAFIGVLSAGEHNTSRTGFCSQSCN